jgi:hypothetical protein
MSVYFENTLGLVYCISGGVMFWMTDQNIMNGAVFMSQCNGNVTFDYSDKTDRTYSIQKLIDSNKFGEIYNAKSAYENVINCSFDNMGYEYCKIMKNGDAVITKCGNLFVVEDLVNSYYILNIGNKNNININNIWFYKTKEVFTKYGRLENMADMIVGLKDKKCKIDTWRHYPINIDSQFYRIEIIDGKLVLATKSGPTSEVIYGSQSECVN